MLTAWRRAWALPKHAVLQEQHAIGQRKVSRIVAHEHHAQTFFMCKMHEEVPQARAQVGVEIGEHLIEHEVARLHGEHARKGQALELAAGKLRDIARLESSKLGACEGGCHAPANLGLRESEVPRSKRHLIENLRGDDLIDRILAHEPHAAPYEAAGMRTSCRILVVHPYHAGLREVGRAEQAGERGLARAVPARKHHQFAGAHRARGPGKN